MTQLVSSGSGRTAGVGAIETAQSKGVGYLSRQPILDQRGGVFGYELDCHEPFGQKGEAGSSIASNGMLDALALYGVRRLAAGAWGFVKCSLEMIIGDLFEGVPPELTVLEIPYQSEPSEKLIRACSRLKDIGFRLALLDFESSKPKNPLVRLIDYIKVDWRNLEGSEWKGLQEQIRGTNVTVIADKVHTHQAFCKARALGINHFQGFYFCHPELLPNGRIPTNRAHYVEILRQLFRDPLELKTLCPLVSEDASLVYRVLRFVNSPLCVARHPVTSIQDAIMILGDAAFRRIAALAIQSALSRDQSPELLQMALVRARFCAQAAPFCGLASDEQYLLGMLSLLPPMLRVPMDTILHELPLRTEIREALAGTSSKERSLLTWIENLEDNRTSGCDEISAQYGLDRNTLAVLYLNSLDDGSNSAQIN
jgi:EAL and modified HD-GYP domain-containing signal transduction protein